MAKKKQLPTERRCISQPPDWWAAFQMHAEANGMNLSEFCGDAMLGHIHPKVKAKLSKRIGRGVWNHPPKRNQTDA